MTYRSELEEIEKEAHLFIDEHIFFIFGFSEEEVIRKLKEEKGLTPDDVVGLVGGGYCKKEDKDLVLNFLNEIYEKKKRLSLKYFKESLYYNLSTLEYCCGLTPLSEVFDDMCITKKDINDANISDKDINDTIKEYMKDTEYAMGDL